MPLGRVGLGEGARRADGGRVHEHINALERVDERRDLAARGELARIAQVGGDRDVGPGRGEPRRIPPERDNAVGRRELAHDLVPDSARSPGDDGDGLAHVGSLAVGESRCTTSAYASALAR